MTQERRVDVARELALKFGWLNRDEPKLADDDLQKEFDGLYDPDAPEWKSFAPGCLQRHRYELGNQPDARCNLTPWQWIIGKLV